ncbi:MAG: hypothetical protein WC406_06045, partial [Methanoregula sp.]
VGLILYGASVYILSVSGVSEFSLQLSAAGRYIMYSTILGLASAVAGVIVQYVINKKMAEREKQRIIEVI